MYITLRVAASLDLLSDALTEDMRGDFAEKRIGVFDPQWVVTQTDGINSWMKNEVAEKTGIAANLRFVKMNDIVQLLYSWLCPDSSSLIDKDRMTWAIFSILKEDEFISNYPHIAAYYTDHETRRIALAAEMADLFDQYQIYRHKTIDEWNNNINNEPADQQWQVYLWGRMKQHLGADFIDRTQISKNIMAQLEIEEQKELIRKKLPSLRFFGLAIVTPYFLELFNKLSAIIPIRFYLLNPAPQDLWMDDLSAQKISQLKGKPELLEHRQLGNELLVNWGTILRESYSLLLGHESYVNQYDELESAHSRQLPQTLLNQIQFDIYHNLSNDKRGIIPAEKINDGTIVVNGCFTPVREVEVLYNYLIDCFAKSPHLKARDVVVMANDIDVYAPYIRAVFENAPVKIPYTIADESVSKGNTLFTALRDILNVNVDTFKSEEVLSLLDSSFIRRRFGFTDVQSVRQAVREAGIYFGMPDDAPSDDLYEKTEAWMVSWDYGLKKIMYGLCISGEAEFEDGRSFFVLDTAEGSGMQDRIRLYHFIQVLSGLLQERSIPKTLSEWSEYLGKIMTEMILEEDEDDEDFPRFARLMESILYLDSIAAEEKISYATFRHVFLDRLDQEKRTNRYADAGINFCSMMPMRSVPYHVVALIGMDFDKFPRQDSSLSFSLLGGKKRITGDRCIRENDKHLFLESLLAAREKLYISFLAKDIQRGSDQPPSTLVDELLDYIALNTNDVASFKKSFINIHPLHVFSSRYGKEDSPLQGNYISDTLTHGKEYTKDENREIASPDFSTIQLEKFATFFKHPVKYFFNNQLRIYYRMDEERIPDAEVFELDPLQKWKVKDDLLRQETDVETYITKGKRSGSLPLANMGNVLIKNLNEEIRSFDELVKEAKDNNECTLLEVVYEHDNTKISGNLPVYGNKYIYYAFTKNILKQIMYPWISYLVALCQDDEKTDQLDLVIVYNKKENNITFPVKVHIKGTSALKDFAQKILPEYIRIFKDGHLTPVMFYAPLSPLYYTNNPRGFDAEKLIDVYESELGDDYAKYFHNDVYLKQIVEANNGLYEVFNNEEQLQKWNGFVSLLTSELSSHFEDIKKKPQ
jgi:exodeoxyribonuclease V gamma subunit